MPGDIVEMSFDLSKGESLDVGKDAMVCEKYQHAELTKILTSQVIVLETSDEPIKAGSTFMFYLGGLSFLGEFKVLKLKMDKRTGKVLEENPTSGSAGDALMAEIKAHGDTFAQAFSNIPSFGRFCFNELNS